MTVASWPGADIGLARARSRYLAWISTQFDSETVQLAVTGERAIRLHRASRAHEGAVFLYVHVGFGQEQTLKEMPSVSPISRRLSNEAPEIQQPKHPA